MATISSPKTPKEQELFDYPLIQVFDILKKNVSVYQACRVKVQSLNYNLIKGLFKRHIHFNLEKKYFQLVSCRSESSKFSLVVV